MHHGGTQSCKELCVPWSLTWLLRKTRRRLSRSSVMSTRAASVINDVPQFGFLDETYQPLDGTLADKQSLSPIPYTGADRNIMCLQYAVNQGFKLKTGQKHCSYFQFADGSHDRTVGQVETYWTLANDGRIPVTFEVLEYCCSDVIEDSDGPNRLCGTLSILFFFWM